MSLNNAKKEPFTMSSLASNLNLVTDSNEQPSDNSQYREVQIAKAAKHLKDYEETPKFSFKDMIL